MRIRIMIGALAGISLAIGMAVSVPAAAIAAPAASGNPATQIVKSGAGTTAVHKGSRITPDENYFIAYQEANWNQNGNFIEYGCAAGMDYRGYPWKFEDPTLSVANHCADRVYMQYADGASDCVNPGATRNITVVASQDPDGVLIGSSTDNC